MVYGISGARTEWDMKGQLYQEGLTDLLMDRNDAA